ncbi:MAG: hypothetical protein HYU59_01345 [Magnetospirillum gryphiswaldense]|nr:hypothetical protein [Magnetospirillum gryphiswaldense]
MDKTTMQRMREHVKLNEGVITKPYRDNKGLLTAGSGFKVDTEDSFAALPFQVKDAKTGQWRDAKDNEKRDEFKRIQSLSKTQLEKTKTPYTSPRSGSTRRWNPRSPPAPTNLKRRWGPRIGIV